MNSHKSCMTFRIATAICLLSAVACCCSSLPAEELVSLRGSQAELVWTASGGALISFRFHDEATNPLNFEITPDIEQRRNNVPFLRGHFLCLDRWGAPSKAEESRGVPFHGEAPRIVWKVDQPP